MTTLYGIKQCDTVRKAQKWLASANIEFNFHDFRVDGLSEALLQQWCKQLDWNTLLNTRSTTWRQLDAADKENLDEAKAKALMLANPTLIKRPVLDSGKQLLVGFSPCAYEGIF